MLFIVVLQTLCKYRNPVRKNAVSHLCVGNVKRYTGQHEWIEIDNDNIGIILPVAPAMLTKPGTIGITDHAQNLLGDVVFVELPPIDSFVAKGGIYSPDFGLWLTL
jgi:hypothetical protein